jgi:hypothetical protein
MQDKDKYLKFAEDCRRMARGMNLKDSQILLQMAEVWELRARDAERYEKKSERERR